MTVGSPTSKRILVIDDDHDVADSFVMLLEAMGADVRVAYSGEEGLKALQAFRPEVVFLDIGMPVMDGYQIARSMRTLPEGQKVCIVAVTGWGPKQIEKNIQAAGFDGHITKPALTEDFSYLLN